MKAKQAATAAQLNTSTKQATAGLALMGLGVGVVVGGLALMADKYKQVMAATVQTEELTGMHAQAASELNGQFEALGGTVDQVAKQLKTYDKTYVDLTDSTRKASAAQTEALTRHGPHRCATEGRRPRQGAVPHPRRPLADQGPRRARHRRHDDLRRPGRDQPGL